MRGPLRIFVALLCLASAARPLGAQELGLVAVAARSGNAELPDPYGLGAFAQFRGASWLFRLSLVRYGDDTDKAGTVCQVYSPRIGCHVEKVSTSARMGGLRLTAMRGLKVRHLLDLGVGGGLSFNQLTAEAKGESGFRADLQTPNTGQIGYLGITSIALTPIPSVPVKLVAGLTGHWVRFRGCASAEDKTSGYAPFCGWNRFTEVQAGLSVTVPRKG
jgi:hypothetical protein